MQYTKSFYLLRSSVASYELPASSTFHNLNSESVLIVPLHLEFSTLFTFNSEQHEVERKIRKTKQ